MSELTQEQRVLDRIKEVGYVDNFWAFHNYILRLGAIMHGLKNKGHKVYALFGKDLNRPKSDWKNYYYFLDHDQLEAHKKLQQIYAETPRVREKRPDPYTAVHPNQIPLPL